MARRSRPKYIVETSDQCVLQPKTTTTDLSHEENNPDDPKVVKRACQHGDGPRPASSMNASVPFLANWACKSSIVFMLLIFRIIQCGE